MDGTCSGDALVLEPSEAHRGLAVMTLASSELVALATQTANGTKMPRADWKVMNGFPVMLPPANLAGEFTGLIDNTLGAATSLMFDRELAGRLRDLLLPKLVTGQIDVSDLDLDAGSRGRAADGGPVRRVGGGGESGARSQLSLAGRSATAGSEEFGSAGTLGRDSIADVVLVHRLRDAIVRLNPGLPALVAQEALDEFVKDRSAMDPVRANKAVHELLRDGYRASWRNDDGDDVYETVRFIDFARGRQRLAGCLAGADRGGAAQASFRHDLVRQRHPAGALQFKVAK
ncbi:MAG: hypothetical protein R2704_16990 [Microthrixaceae bacterium]